MAAEADANYGFKGAVTSAQTPIILGRGVLYSVEGPGDLAVTAGGSGDRAITVAPGAAWGDGVLSIWNSGAVLNGEAVNSGSRWDTVVIRREWTPNDEPTGAATLMLLEGGTSAVISPSRTTDRGVTTSDQPLALVRFDAGSTNVGQIIDLRVWAGQGGGLVAMHDAVRQYLDAPGSQFYVGPVLHVRRMNANGTASWVEVDLASGEIDQARLGSSATTTNTATFFGSATGWSHTINAYSSQLLINGSLRALRLYVRKTSGAIQIGSNGNLTDTTIGTLTAPHRPRVRQVASFIYYSTGGGTYGGTCFLEANGDIVLASGTPNTDIRAGSAALGYSVLIGATYLAN